MPGARVGVAGLLLCAWAPTVLASEPCERRTIRIDGVSMAPRLKHGEEYQTEIGINCMFLIRRGDIVLFANTASPTPLAKQVIAVPGDEWAVTKSGVLLVNGLQALNSNDETYTLNRARRTVLQVYEQDFGDVMPPDTYFLMGEMPGGTLDSSRIGLISRSDIIGRVLE